MQQIFQPALPQRPRSCCCCSSSSSSSSSELLLARARSRTKPSTRPTACLTSLRPRSQGVNMAFVLLLAYTLRLMLGPCRAPCPAMRAVRAIGAFQSISAGSEAARAARGAPCLSAHTERWARGRVRALQWRRVYATAVGRSSGASRSLSRASTHPRARICFEGSTRGAAARAHLTPWRDAHPAETFLTVIW